MKRLPIKAPLSTSGNAAGNPGFAGHALRLAKSAIGSAALLLMVSLVPLSSLAADAADVEDFLATGSCPGCNLSGAFLDTVAAEGGNIGNANLSDASLYRANLSQANLSGADLSGANLRKASLDGADLTDVTLLSADLTGVTLVSADLTGVLTDVTTTCPNGLAGPCVFLEDN